MVGKNALDSLPIDAVLPELTRSFATARRLVLEAPPGAGKTTRVPPALLALAHQHNPNDAREIVVLEPRRLAARLAAKRVAEEAGESLGDTVGYTVRFEDRSSARTRIRFVTEGILTRKLLAEPTLPNVSAVVLDEFHERHIHGDVALGLLRRLQRTARPDLGIVVMSATLDGQRVADYMEAPLLRSEGKMFDVAVEHQPKPDDRKLELQVASALRAALAGESTGDVLVFLPGAAEIRRAREACEKIAQEHDLFLCALHGELPPDEQDRAIAKNPKRKVILSTNVAESSVTINGVTCVIDSGLVRSAAQSAWSQMSTLTIAKASRASCIQRAGRAGRTAPGRCIRLYTKSDFDTRPDHDLPELLRSDLSDLVLELRASGIRDVEWFDAPKSTSLASAEALLIRLGALSAAGDITEMGKKMVHFPVHPRLAKLMFEGDARGVGEDAATLAALLSERDIRSSRTFGPAQRYDGATARSDTLLRLELFQEAEGSGFSASSIRAIGLEMDRVRAVERARKHVSRTLRAKPSSALNQTEWENALLISLLAAFPDRVARRKRPGSRELALSLGSTAELSETSAVRDAQWMVCVDADEKRGGISVRGASEIAPEWLIDLFPDQIIEQSDLTWNERAERVESTNRMAYDALSLSEDSGPAKPSERVSQIVFNAALEKKMALLGGEGMERFLRRVAFADSQSPSGHHAFETLAEETLKEACEGSVSFADLRSAGLRELLQSKVDAKWLNTFAPERLTLASGRSVEVNYDEGKAPWIESYLQDFFGMKRDIAIGSTKISIHLLAPNKRAVQVTQDLEGFWARHYPAIRKELSRRYPRHAWPEDPSVPIPMKHRPPRS